MLSGEAARREKRGRQTFSHARGHLRVSGVLLRRTEKKRETARSLIPLKSVNVFPQACVSQL